MTLCLKQTQTFVNNNVEFQGKHRTLNKLGYKAFDVVYKLNIHYHDAEVDSTTLNIICGGWFYVLIENVHTYKDVTTAGEGLQNLRVCSALVAFEKKGIFIGARML